MSRALEYQSIVTKYCSKDCNYVLNPIQTLLISTLLQIFASKLHQLICHASWSLWNVQNLSFEPFIMATGRNIKNR